MKTMLGILVGLMCLVITSCNSGAADDKKWTILFDGKDVSAWRGHNSDKFPAKGWSVQDGLLVFDPAKGSGGDIVTVNEYSDFELQLETRLSKGANTGIKYFVVESLSKGSAGLGLEYQLLDDANHPDAKAGKNGNRTFAALYDLIAPAPQKVVKPIGEWNTIRIVSKGKTVQHWLNGKKVVEYTRDDPAFRQIVAQSKYKDIPNFGLAEKGRILLQDHGNLIYFRNIKIRTL